ncbi:MAG: hypothetical protein N2250_09275 [Pseudothermotoga sp.]|nr:hypothetical protein [Pseudothermotoga sp.]
MCGIAGIMSMNQLNANYIKLMTDRLKHRGPDDEGFLVLNFNNETVLPLVGDDSKVEGLHILSCNQKWNILLGHRRLSIIDLSNAGHQPMSDSSGKIWIVFNGEIYNYLELRSELKDLGYNFRTNTDTEVIINSYIEC